VTETAPRAAKLDLNTATPAELAGLPGLTPALAEQIVAYRPFTATKELLRVPGLEFELFEQLKRRVKVGRPRAAAPRAPRKRQPRRAPAEAPPPVAVHVHVNAAAPYETTTFRTTAAPPPPISEVIEPLVIAEPAPRTPFGRQLAATPTRALVPLGAQVTTALFESYAGPRVVFALFSFTLAAIALAFATGRLSLRWDPAPPTSAPAVIAAAATPTLEPLATQVSQAVAATLAAQPSPTAPPEPTATADLPAATPTTAFISNSGLDGVGAQIFNETFIPAGYWSVGETDFSNIFVDTGTLAILVKTPGSIAWAFNGYSAEDFYFQGLLRLGACQLGDYGGLIFRGQDDNNLYLFGLSCDGRYRLVERAGGEFRFLIDFTFTPEASTGSGATNLLAVRAEGRKLSLYINDQFVNAVEDVAPSRGFFGAFAKAGTTTNLRVDLDDLSAWSLGP